MVYQYQHRDDNPIATLGDFIFKKDGALSKDFCKKVIEKFDGDDRKYEGKIGTGQVDSKIKCTLDLQVTSLKDEGWAEEDEIFYESLRIGLDEYNTHCKSIHNIIYISEGTFGFNDTGYQIQRYEPGGFYDWHHDWTMEGSSSRCYTYIWYLNSIKKVDEGYTQFIDGTKVKPKAGRLVIFPALWPYIHRAYPAKVRKYICTGWIYGKLK